MTSVELEELVRQVRQLQGRYTSAAWDLGRALAALHSNGEWRNSVPADKEAMQAAKRPRRNYPIGSGWEWFCEAHLGMSGTHAHNLAKASKMFTREDFEKFGPTKLGLAMACPFDSIAALMHLIENGASCREVKGFVRAVLRERKS